MDVLKKIIIKLQKRVIAGAATLLVKVKAHRGDPLNEEADIRAEMGLHKEQKEVRWNNPTNRTIYRWKAGPHTRSTTWTNTVRNRKNKCPKGILPSGRPLHTNAGDGGWMGKLAPGLGRVSG